MTTISIRSMVPGDLPAVLEVLVLALGEPPGLGRTKDLWTWKHIDNPFGRSIVLLAMAGDQIAGVRAFMRWELTTATGETLRCVRAVDTATHPDFHRQGIFQTLTEAAVEEASANGVDLIFNTPNFRSGSGYLKMGWEEVGPIRVMVRPSRRLLSKSKAEHLVDIPAGAPSQTPLDRVPLGMRTVRSPEYLAWRYGSHPTARYRSMSGDGSAVVVRENQRSGRPELVVSELLGPSPGPALRSVARRSRAAYLVGSFPSGTPERRAALKAGMLPVPGVRALTLFARPLRPLSGIHDPRSWDISLGDLELL